jgi:uncharacterized protein
MDKIGSLGSGNFSYQDKDKKKVKKKEAQAVSFLSALDRVEDSTAAGSLREVSLGSVEENDLEQLLDDLHQLGERLKQAPTMTAVLEYKRSVKEFLRYVVSHALEVEEREGVKFANPLKKQKKYTMIKVIDQKVEQLAAGVLQNQRSQLDMLKAVDEIYGLLVDLMR